jgi:hypothetical protein
MQDHLTKTLGDCCIEAAMILLGAEGGRARIHGNSQLPPAGTANTLRPRQKAAAILRRNKTVINTYIDLRRVALNTDLTKNGGSREGCPIYKQQVFRVSTSLWGELSVLTNYPLVAGHHYSTGHDLEQIT